MRDPSKTLPECPRCGYDLTGQVDSWTDRCPLEGVCSECGLRLEFGAILNDTLARKWRFFEVAESRLVRAFLTTANRSLRPWVFWRWVRMEHSVRPRRMWPGAVFGAAWLYVGMALIWATLLSASEFLAMFLGIERYRFWLDYSDQAFRDLRFALTPADRNGYGQWLGSLTSHTVIGLLLVAIMPACFLCLPTTLQRARVRRRHLVRITAWSIVAVPLLVQATKCGFRLAAAASVYLDREWGWRLESYARQYQGRYCIALIVLWVLLWWFLACRDYLKLPRAFAVALAMLVMALLAALLIAIMIPGATVSLLT